VLELRLDLLAGAAEVRRLLLWIAHRPKLPTIIATCRRRPAGGQFKGSIDAELSVLKQAVQAGCQWCDVEIETAGQLPSEAAEKELAPARILVSAHDFQRLPRDLPALLARLDSCQADAIKIAATCHSLADVRRLLELPCTRKDVVAIPMGEEMLSARILALRAGSALTYAPIAQSTAPGQISLAGLQRVYRLQRRFGKFTGVNARTSVYGVIADPVAHSLSPLMHNAGFAARQKNAIYLPFRVRDISDFVQAIEPLGIAGFSVTIPHKERILSYLDECDLLAAEIGAVNTVVVRSGKLYGYNTDFVGVLRAMEKRLPLAASRVLLLGAGGSARAAAFALAHAGADLTIWARRRQRAQALARVVGGEPISRRDIQKRSFDAIVNCTPVGMHPNRGSPLEGRELNCRVVMDLIYRPLKTELLRFAERRGIETISGADMFLAQGAAQWELWMREPAPKVAMRRAVLSALKAEESLRPKIKPETKR
jgi:3-dehydroquinate dehydratase/shikimate dehydrogenase